MTILANNVPASVPRAIRSGLQTFDFPWTTHRDQFRHSSRNFARSLVSGTRSSAPKYILPSVFYNSKQEVSHRGMRCGIHKLKLACAKRERRRVSVTRPECHRHHLQSSRLFLLSREGMPLNVRRGAAAGQSTAAVYTP